jgi:hypothetical protein
MIARIVVLSTFLLILLPAMAQQSTESFVLNDSNPYVYMKLDHVGPREPLINGEPRTGAWIRIVNNSRVPILVPTAGTPNKEGAIEILDEVVPVGQNAVTITTDDGKKESELAQRPKPPEGYAAYASHVSGLTRVASGDTLLFSVPIDHVVGPYWYMRVRFSLDISGSQHGPYSYVDSFTVYIPAEYTREP